METTRPATRLDEVIERHPWVAYVILVLMALLCSVEVG